MGAMKFINTCLPIILPFLVDCKGNAKISLAIVPIFLYYKKSLCNSDKHEKCSYKIQGGNEGMSVKKYDVFLRVVELGSLTKAAEALGYTQSGVSHIIGSLEDELGFPLLLRGRAGARLTDRRRRARPAVYPRDAQLCGTAGSGRLGDPGPGCRHRAGRRVHQRGGPLASGNAEDISGGLSAH
jgi:hypothetical protein